MAQVLELPATEPQVTQPQQKGKDLQEHAPSPQLSGWNACLLAAWFGLLTGLVETLWRVLGRYGSGELIFTGNHAFWTAPVVQMVAALLLGLPLMLLAWRTRRCSENLAVMLLGFLALYNTMMVLPYLDGIAEFLLACGLTAQLSRYSQNHPGLFVKMARTSLPYLLAGVLIVIAVVEGLPPLRENLFQPAPLAMASKRPNVLLVVMDTVRADALQLDRQEGPSRTPHLREFAQHAVVFRQAHATAPWTLPSHGSMLTSRLPNELSARWYVPLPDKFPTLSQWLKDHGYRTGGFVANTIYCSRETGLDRGFEHYEDYILSPGQMLQSTAWGQYLVNKVRMAAWYDNDNLIGRRTAAQMRRRLFQWLERDDARPYFAMVNLFDAHHPYVAPEDFQHFKPTSIADHKLFRDWWSLDKTRLTDRQQNIQHTAYEDCVRYLDDQIGRMLQALRAAGHLQNTLVIITADHGEHFGDHALYGHGNSLYEAAIHVPLLLWWEGLPSQQRSIDAMISLRDLPATVAEWALPEVPHPFLGSSLLRCLETSGQATGQVDAPLYSQLATPSRVPVCGGTSPVFRGPMQAVIYQGYKYITIGDHEESLFDLRTDPDELLDLAPVWGDTHLLPYRELLRHPGTEPSTSLDQEPSP